MFRTLHKMTEATNKFNSSLVSIGTHSGCFHADEALAVYMLRLLPTYHNSRLIRSRDPAVLSACHTVVDVGGKYDPSSNRYDHHQRGFDATFPNRHTKLSSAGLVYLHFGKDIIAQHLGLNEVSGQETKRVEIIWKKLYESFIEALDAHDNGISVYDPEKIEAAGLKKRFSDGSFNLGGMVARLNPKWNHPMPSDPDEAQQVEDDFFLSASARIGEEFHRDLEYFTKSWMPARELVKMAYSKRKDYEEGGRILVFEEQVVPWKDHLFEIEGQDDLESRVLYVLYPENSTANSKWRIQCAPSSKDSFESRKPLPESWRGLRDKDLDLVTGISGGIFIHASGFTGGHNTREGVFKMASEALRL